MKKPAVNMKGLSEEKAKKLPGSDPSYSTIRNGVFCSQLIEPIPNFVVADCEQVYSGKNNNYIVMGRDRHRSRNTGYGGKGDTQASMIDMVVGRMAHEPKDDVWVDPNFSKDSARIYISQKTDVDKNFSLVAGSLGVKALAKAGAFAKFLPLLAKFWWILLAPFLLLFSFVGKKNKSKPKRGK